MYSIPGSPPSSSVAARGPNMTCRGNMESVNHPFIVRILEAREKNLPKYE